MKNQIPNFYDRYVNKFSSIINTLLKINELAIECGLGELFLNGDNTPRNFGGCEECRMIGTYQISATSTSLRCVKNKSMVIEIEKGYNYQIGGDSNYFLNLIINTNLLNDQYDKLMNFVDRFFFELSGHNYNLILSQKQDSYINFVYVPIQRQEHQFVTNSNNNLIYNPLIWLVSSIVGNFSNHEFYIEGLPDDVLTNLSDDEILSLKQNASKNDNAVCELISNLTHRLNVQQKKLLNEKK